MKILKSHPELEVFEWESGDWLFHGKGAWLYNERNKVDLTVVGSSNFSYRSNRRDTEVQLYMLSQDCDDLSHRLAVEAEGLFEAS